MPFMRTAHLVLVAALVALVGFGCQQAKTVEGKWRVTGAQLPAGAQNGTVTAELQGGTAKMTVEADLPGNVGSIALKFSGTYTYEDETLTTQFGDVELDTSKVEAVQRPMIEALAPQFKSQVAEAAKKAQVAKVTWQTPDSFTVTVDGNTNTFTRYKGE